MRVLMTRSGAEPAASSAAVRLRSARSAWAAAPSASSPLAGSAPIWPAVTTSSPLRIAWLYGPMAAGAPLVSTAVRTLLELLFVGHGLDRSRFQALASQRCKPADTCMIGMD